MKKNLIYILTLLTIVIALNYMHIHTDPYPDSQTDQDGPFFAQWLQTDAAQDDRKTAHTNHAQCSECTQASTHNNEYAS